MGEIGRSDLQRIIQLVLGVLLFCVGGLLSWACMLPNSEVPIVNIALFCLGIVYLGMGVVLFSRRQEWILRWRMCLASLAGLSVWFALFFCITTALIFWFSYHRLEQLYWPNDIVPVLIGSALAGYIARRLGLILGGMIGTVHQLFFLYLLWGSVVHSGHPPTTIIKIIEEYGLLPSSVLMNSLIVLIIGMASGYLGQFLANRVPRHSDSLDQQTSTLERKDRLRKRNRMGSNT
jgi:hypothetical protein